MNSGGRRAWISIETPDGRKVESVHSTPEFQGAVLDALNRHIAGG